MIGAMEDGKGGRRLAVHLVVRKRDAPRPIAGAAEEVTIRLGLPELGRLLELEARIDGVSRTGRGATEAIQVQLELDVDALVRQLSSVLRELADGPVPPPAPAPPRGSFRALLIEDNPQISEMYVYGIRRYFENRGVHAVVDVASDAETALARLGADRYDLVVTDFYLPGTDGAQLVARLRRQPGLEHLPVVAISAGGKDVRAALTGAGADRFLQKPIVLRDLFTTLEQLLKEKGGGSK
jgi:CheY-like chemotaxis protein